MFLHQKHSDLAANYNADNARREWSNKFNQYRRVVISYAEGDVLECGIGTGHTLQFYDRDIVDKFIGIDWSTEMLEQSFEAITELKSEKKFPFTKLQEEGKFKLIQADNHNLPFEDKSFDTVVDSLSL